MNKIGILLKKIVKEDIKQPEICYVRAVNGGYIDCEKINTQGFNESIQNDANTFHNVRLTIDQTSTTLTYNKPVINSRVLVVWTSDDLPIAIMYNQIGNIITNYINQTINVNNTTLYSSGTTSYSSAKDIDVKTQMNINLTATQSISEKGNGISLDGQAGLITIKNSSGDITGILNNIVIALTAINGKLAAITGPTGAEAAISALPTQISLLF
jgi:hypothetical protein